MIPLWMFPLAVATGNTMLLKPSERDPGAAMLIAELALEVGRVGWLVWPVGLVWLVWSVCCALVCWSAGRLASRRGPVGQSAGIVWSVCRAGWLGSRLWRAVQRPMATDGRVGLNLGYPGRPASPRVSSTLSTAASTRSTLSATTPTSRPSRLLARTTPVRLARVWA